MTIHSFGCSFVFGSDLDPSLKPDQASDRAWPACLAHLRQQAYLCHAYPGIGNLQIAQSIFDCVFQPNDIAVISWTWIDRFDQRDYPGAWYTIRPDNPSGPAKLYYRDLHSQYRDQLTNLLYVHSVQQYLKSQNIAYIMTYMDRLLWQTVWHRETAIDNLVALTQPLTFDFDGRTFLEWSQDHGYDISENLHPLASAHQHAAEYVNSIWDRALITTG